MNYYKKGFLKDTAKKYMGYNTLSKSFINEATKIESKKKAIYFEEFKYDIFLSHAYDDKEIIFGLYCDLTYNFNFNVYVDWMVDPSLNRGNVTRENANFLRKRMKQCKSLIYVVSSNSQNSDWMQWETGYFDGLKGKVAILPILGDFDSTFDEQEYLKLYPIIDRRTATVFINRLEGIPSYKKLNEWIV
jgi:hypothetical protein